MTIRITTYRAPAVRLLRRYVVRRRAVLHHQAELQFFGSEEALANRDKVASWPEERRTAFFTWANEMAIPNYFDFVDEFEYLFPERTTAS